MNIPYVFKRCTKCGEILLATSENFHKKKDRKYGLNAKCKKCIAKYSKTYYEEHKEEKKAYRETHKEEAKAYREAHKEEAKAYNKTYRETHKEEIKAYGKVYREVYYEVHKEEIKAQQKAYYEANKEEVNARNKTYRQSDKGQVVVFNNHNKRRARISLNGGEITPDQWLECMKYFDFTCSYSGEKLNKDNRSLDHIVPVKAGGSNNIWNVVPMLKSLNSSKKDKDFLEWYQEQPFFSKERLAKIYEWMEYSKNKYENMEVIKNV